ncbi:MAG: outer-membrane lipoprotein carrier protein LolA [Candidatus Endonucleobacter bathymodioli]|uniref:Outer-membrane lipoprotein carrier protein LolA n=1 Tax=Candidatus Endonucleibacter bathymodioli TaxID=539814 RepID=A0AA90SSC6_9GAMM|nr:outer-membrane lipoprotein carrier protein LolA [Candidatus Endonucleobacter bathymodioli]
MLNILIKQTVTILVVALSCHAVGGLDVRTRTVVAADHGSGNAVANKRVQVKTALARHDEKAAELLLQKLKSIKTLKAAVSQEVVINNDSKRVSSGTLQIKRPDMFIWGVEKPYRQEFIVKNGKSWNIDHGLMQVIIKKQDDGADHTPVQLLSGNIDVFLKGYNIIFTESHKIRTYSLRPSGDKSLFELLEIRFKWNEKTKADELIGFVMLDTMGGTSRFDLSKVTINEAISDATFQAKYSKEYDVIDETVAIKVVR